MSTLDQDTPTVRGLGVGAKQTTAERQAVSTSGGRRWHSGLTRVVSPIVVLIIWQLTNTFALVSTKKLPPPSAVVSEAWTLITTNSPAYGTLQGALLVSLERFAIGFAFGGTIAMVLAISAGLSRVGDNAIDPLMQMVRTLPLFGLIPVFIVWFGIGELPKILLVALASVVPLYLNAYSGIRAVDAKLHELGQVLALNRSEMLRHVILPGALPSILVGLRQSLGFAWLSLVVAEQINANAGLGFQINQATEFLQNSVIFVDLLVYTILGLLTDWLVRILERRALRWQPELSR